MNNSKIIAFLMLCITVAVCCAADLKTYKALKGLLRQLTMQDKLTRPLTSSTKSSGSLKATRSFRQSRL